MANVKLYQHTTFEEGVEQISKQSEDFIVMHLPSRTDMDILKESLVDTCLILLPHLETRFQFVNKIGRGS